MANFRKKLYVNQKHMCLHTAEKAAKANLQSMNPLMVKYRRLRVDYWYDVKRSCFVVAYSCDVQWKRWYLPFHAVRGLFRWRRR